MAVYIQEIEGNDTEIALKINEIIGVLNSQLTSDEEVMFFSNRKRNKEQILKGEKCFNCRSQSKCIYCV